MLHASLDKWCKGRSVAEFEAIHKKLLAKIIELHGMSAAMFILSQGLQWMSQLPSAYHTTGDVLSDDDLTPEAHIKPLSLWHAALEKVHDLPDPWADRQLGRLPLQHGVRKRFNPVTREWLTDDVLLKMEPEPFARGSMRCCYRMKAFLTSFSRNWEKASNLVAKQYLSPNVESSEYYRDVQTQMQAKHYSEEYNRRNPPKKVDFIQCWVLELDDRPAPHHLFCVESMIQGKYTKYNSNAGFVADEFLRNTPQAFSHWTYEFSNGKEIVVDIQGVGDLYTDPQIHTRDHKVRLYLRGGGTVRAGEDFVGRSGLQCRWREWSALDIKRHWQYGAVRCGAVPRWCTGSWSFGISRLAEFYPPESFPMKYS